MKLLRKEVMPKLTRDINVPLKPLVVGIATFLVARKGFQMVAARRAK
jgi:hypothetical protein